MSRYTRKNIPRNDVEENYNRPPSRRPEHFRTRGYDEIEYLREGGNIREHRGDLESIGSGSYRTYSHNFDQDGDDDFDSSYGYEKELYEDTEAEKRFLRGENENGDYGSSSGYGTYGRNADRNERHKYGAATGYAGHEYSSPSPHDRTTGNRRRGR